ncbi:unnamed protein product [Trifolium pratense]|uniref:Uncharacterized protein n=1 Tax=Trifolium pratense TaxID=57577 RepID=A0ACB0IPN3_TRIPR|nr:unnamed protein product [Trifolium pratense]
MALHLSNIFGCFSESSPQSKRYTCNGDVCVLRKTSKEENLDKKSPKQKQSPRISFSRFSIKSSPRDHTSE